jgi:acyl carrier protein
MRTLPLLNGFRGSSLKRNVPGSSTPSEASPTAENIDKLLSLYKELERRGASVDESQPAALWERLKVCIAIEEKFSPSKKSWWEKLQILSPTIFGTLVAAMGVFVTYQGVSTNAGSKREEMTQKYIEWISSKEAEKREVGYLMLQNYDPTAALLLANAKRDPAARPLYESSKSSTDPNVVELATKGLKNLPITERVRKIVVQHLGIDGLKVIPTANLIHDLGADDLDMIELVMAFEEEFGCPISDEVSKKIRTIQGLIQWARNCDPEGKLPK